MMVLTCPTAGRSSRKRGSTRKNVRKSFIWDLQRQRQSWLRKVEALKAGSGCWRGAYVTAENRRLQGAIHGPTIKTLFSLACGLMIRSLLSSFPLLRDHQSARCWQQHHRDQAFALQIDGGVANDFQM